MAFRALGVAASVLLIGWQSLLCGQAPPKDSNLATPGNKAPAKDTEQTHSAAPSDIPQSFSAPLEGYDYSKREVMIPMRDGVRLHTMIVVPKGRKGRADFADAHSLQRIQASGSQR